MPASKHPLSVEASCVRLLARAADAASLGPTVERRALSRGANEVLIEIKAAAVNPSDVKAATGLMAYAVFPRTPGRDYAGVIIDGPPGMIGREVFGSSGDLGIRRDGSHATHLTVEADAVVDKPKGISWEAAAGIGVPFVTAMEGFRRAGLPKRDETVLVMGVNGKVGQAAVQIASWRGARVVGVVRKAEPYEGHANSAVEVIDASSTDVAARLREKGHDVTVLAPSAAAPEIVKVAVIEVELTTVTPLTVTPVPDTFTPVAPVRFVPVRVTGTEVPRAPVVGAIAVSVGAGVTVPPNSTAPISNPPPCGLDAPKKSWFGAPAAVALLIAAEVPVIE